MSGERWVIKMCLATGDPPEYLACGNKKWAADSKQDLVINKTSTLSLTSPSSSLSTSYPGCQRFIFLHLHFCSDDELVAECGPGCDPRHKEMSANLMNLVKSLRILCRLNAQKRAVNFRETSSKIVVIVWNMKRVVFLKQVQMQNKSFSDRRICAASRVPTIDDGIVGPLRASVSVLSSEFSSGLHILVGV